MTSHSPRLTRWSGRTIVVVSLAGLALSALLLAMSLPVSSGVNPLSELLCKPGERMNCVHVLRSPSAHVGPLPASGLGIAYFFFLLVWSVGIGPPNARGRRWQLVPMAVTTVGLAVSAYFVYLMAVRLPVWCVWCLVVHALNLSLFLLVIAVRPKGGGVVGVQEEGVVAEPDRADEVPYPTAGRTLVTMVLAILMIAVVAMTLAAYRYQLQARQYQFALHDATSSVEYVRWQLGRTPVLEIPLREDDLSVGRADAPHVLVVFSDFECPTCAMVHRWASRLVGLFPAELRCVLRQYPLNGGCNRMLEGEFHYFACEAAEAAEAARLAGRPDQAGRYASLLFENQARLAERPYIELAREAGIDAARFSAAMQDAAIQSRIDEDVALGGRLKVEGTPALFLDGRRMSQWQLSTRSTAPQVDAEATVRLWEALLGRKAERSGGANTSAPRGIEQSSSMPSR